MRRFLKRLHLTACFSSSRKSILFREPFLFHIKRFLTFYEENSHPQRGCKEKQPHNLCDCFSLFIWLGWRDFPLDICKAKSKIKPMLCKYLRSSLKTVHRTVFSPDGVALSSNLSFNNSQVKIKEQAEACSFILAGVERFELPDDGVRVRSLTAWRHPNILFRPMGFACCTHRTCFC